MWTLAYLTMGVPVVLLLVGFVGGSLFFLAIFAAGVLGHTVWWRRAASGLAAVSWALCMFCMWRVLWILSGRFIDGPSAVRALADEQFAPTMIALIGSGFCTLLFYTLSEETPARAAE